MPHSNERVLKHKLGPLNLPEELGNVSKACQVMGLSRDTFYRYKSVVGDGGVEALLEKDRRHPNVKNRTDERTETAVVEYADPERIGHAIDALTEIWSDKAAGDTDETTCAEYCCERGLSDSTLRRELGVLQAALNYDLDKRRLARHVQVFRPGKPLPRERYLSRGEAARLLWANRALPKARWHLALLILLRLYKGAREDAILSLRWSQVDLDGGWINFDAPGVRKTKKKRAQPPIVSRLRVFLRARAAEPVARVT